MMSRCTPHLLEIAVTRTSTRLAAGTLALVLPLAAAAGCGAEKRRTVKAELSSASSNLQSSKAVSFTVRLGDTAGSLKKLATKDKSASTSALVPSLLGGSITYVVDPVGNKTLKELQAQSGNGADLAKALKSINLALIIKDDKAAVGELRLIEGTLYLHVDMNEISRLAGIAGKPDFNHQLDIGIGGNPAFSQGLKDVRAGKWIKLPLAPYLDQFQKLAQSFTHGATPSSGATTAPDYKALGNDLFAAIKPYVKVTDANNSSSDRVLNIDVQARPALKAGLGVLKASKGLPFASLLSAVTDSKIDSTIKDGSVHGTITLASGHLKQVAVDLESFRQLDPSPGTDSLAGSSVIFDVNDRADELAAPTDISSFDVGALIGSFLGGFGQSTATAG